MPAGAGSVTADLAMQLPAVISGHVYDLATGLPIAGKSLAAYSSVSYFRYATTASDGSYSIAGLPPASYSVCVVDHFDAYMNQCWDHIVPDALNFPGNYAPVNVVAGDVRVGIDFHLQIGATVSGSIINRRTGQPPAAGPYLQIMLRTAAAEFVQLPVQLDSNGSYQINGLAPGNYQLIAQSSAPYYTSQLYAGIDCVDSSCEFPMGTFITIDAGLGARNDVDFSLAPGGRLQGDVVQRDTQAPIADAIVELWRRDPVFGFATQIGSTNTDAEGHYALDHVNPYEHLVVVRASTYIPQRYPNVPCWIDCTTGVLNGISVNGPETLTLNRVELDPGVTIAGQARLPGLSSSFFRVSMYDAQGQTLGSVDPDTTGRYQFPARQPGTYFLASFSSTDCQLYQWLPCTDPITSATPVILTTPGTTTYADFDLFIDDILQNGFEAP